MSATTGAGWRKTSSRCALSDARLEAEVVEHLLRTPAPLTVGDIAEALGREARDLDRVLWGRPDLFVWQPGHRWTVATERGARSRSSGISAAEDLRARPLVPHEPRELRAITMASGLTVRVTRRPLDSDAMFSVRSSGNLVELTINSTHEIFGELPMPFDDLTTKGDYKTLVEVLIAGWALYEDGLTAAAQRRAVEDTRLLWGRRAIEVVRDST